MRGVVRGLSWVGGGVGRDARNGGWPNDDHCPVVVIGPHAGNGLWQRDNRPWLALVKLSSSPSPSTTYMVVPAALIAEPLELARLSTNLAGGVSTSTRMRTGKIDNRVGFGSSATPLSPPP